MGMRRTWKGLALTLAGCGALASPALADGTRELHQEVRERVLTQVGGSRDARQLREALAGDPEFDRLLQRIRRVSLWPVHGDEDGEDAVQSALLKMWRGRPELFLLETEEVVRYLKVAARRNLITERSKVPQALGDADDEFSGGASDPVADALAQDLYDELLSRIDDEERAVLESRLDGVASQRDVAKRLGWTRYQAMRAGGDLERKAGSLFDD